MSASNDEPHAGAAERGSGPALRVVDPGWATTVQDRGRAGWAHLGVPGAGAVDLETAALTNRLVGNTPAAPVIETAGGLVVEALRHVLVADSVESAPRSLVPGERHVVRLDHRRAWCYLAVRGGVVADDLLGSVSRDTLSQLGPPPLATGHVVTAGPDPRGPVLADHAARPEPRRVIGVHPGPRVDWFERGEYDRLTTTTWRIGADLSRVAIRLDGGVIRRRHGRELPSEGLVRGAVQVPPDGRPVVMSADHPTTGGYPVIAVVDPDDLVALAQLRPGTPVRFRHVAG